MLTKITIINELNVNRNRIGYNPEGYGSEVSPLDPSWVEEYQFEEVKASDDRFEGEMPTCSVCNRDAINGGWDDIDEWSAGGAMICHDCVEITSINNRINTEEAN